MDALHFLIGRKWPSGRNVGLSLAAATGVVWVSQKLLALLPKPLPLDGLVGLVCWLFALVVVLMSMVAFIFVLGIIPLYTFQRLTGILQSWIRQRGVEEMLSTGLTGRAVLDGLATFGARWWMQASLPSVLLALVLFPELRSVVLCRMIVALLAAGVGFAYFYLSLLTWSVFPGGRALLPALAPMGAVPLISLLAFTSVSATMDVYWQHCLPDVAVIAASLGAILASRWLAIYGLENSESLGKVDSKTRRAIRRRLPSPMVALSENPICARESMRGTDASELGARVLMACGFVMAAFSALAGQAAWGFAALWIPTVLINSYRGAQKMSQVITQETEASTLETVRSTPINSEQFLYGWLRVVVLPQWRAHTLLWAGTFLVSAGVGTFGNDVVSIGVAVALSYVLPLVGAYIGASIAGQAKTRSEISGQLMAAFAAAVILGGPQVAASATLDASLPASIFGLAVLTGGACWLLDAGAKKSLNRVLLPQR